MCDSPICGVKRGVEEGFSNPSRVPIPSYTMWPFPKTSLSTLPVMLYSQVKPGTLFAIRRAKRQEIFECGCR